VKRGICKLCLNERDLLKSHLMPAAMYAYCRAPGGHHISISSDLVIESDRQLADHLLCAVCEDNLNRGGEMWLLPLLAPYQGPFPFYDLLTKVPPDATDGDAAGYAAARNSEIQCDKITHFAMGVFWKAAVHSWSGSRTEPMIDLGKYAEPIRNFLCGAAGFPERMVLTIGVLPPPVEMIAFNNPYRGSNRKWHNYLFYVPGIEFSLNVGSMIKTSERESCFASNPLHPIIVTNFSEDLLKINRMVWKGARKAKNVDKYLKKD
jgi:hypothetical protein